jgi:hypothetical protein
MTSSSRSCLAAASFFLLTLAACKDKQSIETGIIVEVSSDLAVPNEINQIRLTNQTSRATSSSNAL